MSTFSDRPIGIGQKRLELGTLGLEEFDHRSRQAALAIDRALQR